jgi:hypothetical protein
MLAAISLEGLAFNVSMAQKFVGSWVYWSERSNEWIGLVQMLGVGSPRRFSIVSSRCSIHARDHLVGRKAIAVTWEGNSMIVGLPRPPPVPARFREQTLLPNRAIDVSPKTHLDPIPDA